MAKGDSTDLMMKFVRDGKAIAGQCRSELISSEQENKLLKGFDLGFYSEIDRFTLKAGIRDDEAGAGTQTANGQQPQPRQSTYRPGTTTNPNDPKNRPTTSLANTTRKGGFQSWRAGKLHPYPVDLQPISFTRSIDRTSADLIKSCIECKSFDSATLIKRKSSGIESATRTVASGEVFLRLDFIGVLLIKVDWDNDDQVTETCEFICRSVNISYRPQLPDGSLGRVRPGFWSVVKGERPQPLA